MIRTPISMLILSLIFCITAGIFLTTAGAETGQGREQITLFGGKTGTVTLPHHLHQKAVQDCQTCHQSFAQKAGAIEAAKKEGVLKKKQVMNKTCLSCHRSMKKAGEKTGPVSCKSCHIK